MGQEIALSFFMDTFFSKSHLENLTGAHPGNGVVSDNGNLTNLSKSFAILWCSKQSIGKAVTTLFSISWTLLLR